MVPWFWSALAAAVFYGLHQVTTRLASTRIGEGVGGFLVEASAALTILVYLIGLRLAGHRNQMVTASGVWYSLLTGLLVGLGTLAFFLLFQQGGPLSVVPAVLAGGAALMAVAGILFFHETLSWSRLLGIVLSIAGLFLLRR
jgi:bacterial/archaeal transporter family protein